MFSNKNTCKTQYLQKICNIRQRITLPKRKGSAGKKILHATSRDKKNDCGNPVIFAKHFLTAKSMPCSSTTNCLTTFLDWDISKPEAKTNCTQVVYILLETCQISGKAYHCTPRYHVNINKISFLEVFLSYLIINYKISNSELLTSSISW